MARNLLSWSVVPAFGLTPCYSLGMRPVSPYRTGSIRFRVILSISLVTAGMTESIRVFFLVVVAQLENMGLVYFFIIDGLIIFAAGVQ